MADWKPRPTPRPKVRGNSGQDKKQREDSPTETLYVNENFVDDNTTTSSALYLNLDSSSPLSHHTGLQTFPNSGEEEEEYINFRLRNAVREFKPMSEEISGCFPDSPPTYESTVTDGTDVKLITDEGDLPSDQTDTKSFDESAHDEPLSIDDEVDWQNVNKEIIMQHIQQLKREQKELRERQLEHEQKMKELENQPIVKHTMQSFKLKRLPEEEFKPVLPAKGHTLPRQVPPAPPVIRPSPSPWNNATSFQEQIHVQLEQLYSNCHILRLPYGNNSPFQGKALGKSYYDANSAEEVRKLKADNIQLRQKIERLEAEIQSKDKRLQEGRVTPPQPHYLSVDSILKTARSEGRLNDLRELNNPNTPNFVAGRPTSPLPIPSPVQDIEPVETTYKWAITDYWKKLRRETLQGQPQVSSPFYLKHCGHRAQMEVYLNGNGTAKNKCMSVFLRILKGDYDRCLKWPVNFHMTVILVNQSGSNSNSLKAGGTQFQYRRPVGDSDQDADCWGLIEFVSHGMIKSREYIKNGKIELKCRIQFLPQS